MPSAVGNIINKYDSLWEFYLLIPQNLAKIFSGIHSKNKQD